MFVCLGWGSLVWNPDTLPVREPWRHDGLTLPIEFARQSKNGRITLVIGERFAPVQVFWVSLDVSSLEEARNALAIREEIRALNVERSVGVWSETTASGHAEAISIGEWARTIGADGVVWTALRPRFDGRPVTPTCDQVINYLSGLRGETRQLAEQYIRRAPAQIRTDYRAAIEHELGWTAETNGEY